MFSYIRTPDMVFIVNSYSCIVRGERCISLLKKKFTKCGNVILSSNFSQAPKLKHVTRKCNLPDVGCITGNVPRRLWKSRSDFLVSYSFVIHKETAEEIADTIMDSVAKKRKEPIVIELNPGFGLITKQLFERGLKNLVVFDKFILNPFKGILKEYAEKIQLNEVNTMNIKKCFSSKAYLKLLHYISDIKDNEIVIIAMSPNRLFFRRLIYFISHMSFSCCNNVEFYFTIPYRIYNCLASMQDPQARASDQGCFGVLFNLEILKKYPRDYFLPLSTKGNAPDVFFVRMSRKFQILPRKDFLVYMNFLKIIGSKKRNYIIGELEKWFPGSGPRFIAEGVSPTAQVFELTSEDFLKVFNIVQELKGYDDPHFIMDTYDSNFFSEPKIGY